MSCPGVLGRGSVKGKYNKSAIGTLVERRTRYTLLIPLDELNAQSVRNAFADAVP